MQYRKDKKGNDISLLGFGCMRFEGSGTGEYFHPDSYTVFGKNPSQTHLQLA